MKIDYIVSRIEASQDGSPYVYVTYSNPYDFKAGADRGPQFNPFGPNMISFTSPEDLMKNLPKAMGNIGKALGDDGGFPTDSPTFKIIIRDYEDMSIKVGDKVTIEIKKADTSGIRNQFNRLNSLQDYALRCMYLYSKCSSRTCSRYYYTYSFTLE